MVSAKCPDCGQLYVPALETECSACGLDLTKLVVAPQRGWWRGVGVALLVGSAFLWLVALWPTADADSKLADVLAGATLVTTLPIAFGTYALERAGGGLRLWRWSGATVLSLSAVSWVVALWSPRDGDPDLIATVVVSSTLFAVPIFFGLYAIDRSRGRPRPWLWGGLVVLLVSGIWWAGIFWAMADGTAGSSAPFRVALITALPIALGIYSLRRNRRRSPELA
jgi:hypothetical protein